MCRLRAEPFARFVPHPAASQLPRHNEEFRIDRAAKKLAAYAVSGSMSGAG